MNVQGTGDGELTEEGSGLNTSLAFTTRIGIVTEAV